MADLKTLREQMANIATEARSLLDQSSEEKDEARSAELESQHDKAMADYDKLSSQAERLQKLEEAEARVRADRDSVDKGKRPPMDGEGRGSDEDEAPSYRDAFHAYLRSKMEDGDPLSPAQRAVLRAGYAPIEARAQTTTDAAGGYTVPEELLAVLTKSMLAWGPMYDPGVTTELVTTGGGKITMPTVDDTTVTAEAHSEGVTLTDDGGKDVTFGEKELDSYAWNTEWLRISKELADDSIFAMETVIGNLLGERLGRVANLQLTTGSGSSAPNGIVTASGLGVTAVGAAAITFDEVMDLEHSVDPAYRMGSNVRYMLNDSTLLAVRKLKDGDGNYLWQNGNVQAGVPNSINGRPYSINQAMASLATGQRVMLFGDFSKYYVRKVGAPLVGAISDKDFWPGFGMAGYVRFDGELSDTAAVKHLITA